MNNSKEAKSPSYLEQSTRELQHLVAEQRVTKELESILKGFLKEKLRQSIKNGIVVGMKKQAVGQSNGRVPRRAYRQQ